ncbi:hypothetical protein AOQ89_01135 [bacterium endosymbiont of Pedicinus badii]|nr:hypothetical protein AOQ89_01135 [bacterium endosymbiont of Pedicinus badii]
MIYSEILLILFLILNIFLKNRIVFFSLLFLLILKILNLQKYFTFFKSNGIEIGMIVITTSALFPIFEENFFFLKDIKKFFHLKYFIAIIIGSFLSWIAGKGVLLIAKKPDFSVFFLIGITIGILFFNGVSVGPLIAYGIFYLIFKNN